MSLPRARSDSLTKGKGASLDGHMCSGLWHWGSFPLLSKSTKRTVDTVVFGSSRHGASNAMKRGEFCAAAFIALCARRHFLDLIHRQIRDKINVGPAAVEHEGFYRRCPVLAGQPEIIARLLVIGYGVG